MRFFEQRPVVSLITISVILNVFIEVLARHSLFSTLAYIIANPFISIYNCIIILFTLSVALYFSKRYSLVCMVCFLWAILGIVNSVLMSIRGTPLSAVDFTVLKSAYKLVTLYISAPLLIVIILAVILAITAIVFMFVKQPKVKPSYIKAILLTVISACTIFFISEELLTSETVVASETDISKTYSKYGFACCFSYSLIGRGIDTPDTYSKETVEKVLSAIDYTDNCTAEKTPNIIMIQLESFFDPSYIDIHGLKFSEEPVPNFKKLKEEYTHGFLRVPSFGGGTANTEFEVLTQININAFGLGEYPYTTVLKNNSFESLAQYLKKNGYSTHAMHNHIATFYDRNLVYQNLGFDTFTSVEYMTDLEKNDLGWAKDRVLTKEIQKALLSTEEQDFIFAVSVQGHGQYPSEFDGELPITVSGISDPNIKTNLEYYLKQIHEMDEFIAELLDMLSEIHEETTVIFYGDHLPSLKLGDLGNQGLGYYPTSCDRFSTEYVIWSNFGAFDKNENIPAYKLASKVLGMNNIHTGIFTQLNQSTSISQKSCATYSKLLAYDMLYANRYLNDIECIFPSEMRFGIEDITVIDAKISDDYAKIYGNGFTEYSVVCTDERERDTIYVSSKQLLINADDLSVGDTVTVKQKSDGKVLSSSNEIIFN